MNKLKYFRKKYNKSQAEIAELLNITQTAYGNYELGKRQISYASLVKLSEYYGVSVDALMGNVSDTEWREITEEPELHPEEDVMLPLVASLRCGLDSKGVPFTFIKEVPCPVSYVRKWGEDLRLIMAVGDSMSPTIIPGDMLVCKPTSAWESGNVVVVNVRDCDMVKRIYRTADGGIDLRSDNTAYAPIHFSPEELQTDCIHVLGRVMIPIPQEL